MVDHCKLGSEWDMNQQITPVSFHGYYYSSYAGLLVWARVNNEERVSDAP